MIPVRAPNQAPFAGAITPKTPGSFTAKGNTTRRGRQEAWYVCDRAQGDHGQPTCQSIAGAPIDEAVGALIVASMTPAAVELAWEIRREIEARHDEADRLRLRAIERARFDADLAQRRFMLVDRKRAETDVWNCLI
ncbi:hypothetical protein P9281_03015 [Caballeronia sp. LP003]|uniref:hypothetical protein n=1 Tax=Caballeronia sp. LP003 TaxID=3038551 RepID=UPI00286707DE|nr:hypothetical protein [Caballeronia sp. LP003]MDR5785520.1 hypothetical protein [Caballeronia sp. LP003]